MFSYSVHVCDRHVVTAMLAMDVNSCRKGMWIPSSCPSRRATASGLIRRCLVGCRRLSLLLHAIARSFDPYTSQHISFIYILNLIAAGGQCWHWPTELSFSYQTLFSSLIPSVQRRKHSPEHIAFGISTRISCKPRWHTQHALRSKPLRPPPSRRL